MDHINGLFCLKIPLGLINLAGKTQDQSLSSDCLGPLSKAHTPVEQMTTSSYPLEFWEWFLALDPSRYKGATAVVSFINAL